MKIFLVDDSSFILLVCRQALQKAGFTIVGVAYDGEEAVQEVLKSKPDIVLMDIALPKKNGLEASTEILEARPETKIIAVSALDDEWVQEKAAETGCFAFLKKPFTNKELVEQIQAASKNVGELKYG